MDDDEYAEPEISDTEKKEMAKWFLLNAPAGEIEYIAKDLRTVLKDEDLYIQAAKEAFPLYNKSHLICLDMPRSAGQVLITPYGELNENEFIDPRSGQIVIVDHVKQICKDMRYATDEELPSPYVEEFRYCLDVEVLKYAKEAYPKGVSSVYSTKGKHVEEPGSDFELVVVISVARNSPHNFCNGSWRSVWTIEFKDEMQVIQLKGKIQVGAHYYEEGNVQLDTNYECQDSTIFQAPEESGVAIVNIIRNYETEYLTSLQASYTKLPDTTFKDLRRRLPVTRTLFPWNNTMQFNITKEVSKELGIGK